MENNDVITLYKNKIQYKSLLITAIVIIVIMGILIFLETGIVVIMFSIFPLVLGWAFWELNKQNKNRVFVKENGYVYYGEVLHVSVKKRKNKIIRKLLIEFPFGNEKRLIVSEHFPHYINRITKKNADITEYNKCYKENIIEHIQYYGNGYISFEKTEQTQLVYKYKKSKNKNYKGDLTCKVYEFEGKFVVDDFIWH